MFTGTVGPSSQAVITLQPDAKSALSVVTSTPVSAGGSVATGSVIAEVNGRPVFVAESAFSFYRDMGAGDTGPDVEALQRMLAARGYGLTVDGAFNDATIAAVNSLYRDSGYGSPTRAPGDAQGSQQDGSAAPPATQSAYVPLSEIVAMPYSAATVVQGMSVGAPVGGGQASNFIVGAPDLVVTVTATAAEVGSTAKGSAATIDIPGAPVTGTVGEITSVEASSDASDNADVTPKARFTVNPTSPLPADLPAGDVRVVVSKTVIDKALLVPAIAVVDRGGNNFVVIVADDSDNLVEVHVTVLATLDGEAAISPVNASELVAGMKIRVG